MTRIIQAGIVQHPLVSCLGWFSNTAVSARNQGMIDNACIKSEILIDYAKERISLNDDFISNDQHAYVLFIEYIWRDGNNL